MTEQSKGQGAPASPQATATAKPRPAGQPGPQAAAGARPAAPAGPARPNPAPKPAPQNPAPKPAPPKPAPKPPVKPQATPQVIPVASGARARFRHFVLLFSFLVLVVIPAAASFWYLYAKANDQFSSTVAFSVRSEDFSSPLELLGGISQLSSGGSSDSDVLYEYIQSQQLVRIIDDRIDLKTIYSKATDDPIFAFDPSGTIEDLLTYWGRMVNISYDNSTHLIEVTTKAFTAQDAHLIATEIVRESTLLINQLNLSARADATRYANEELDKAVLRLKNARAALTEFRTTTQIIDPTANLQGQMGLLNVLEQQLAGAMIEADLLLGVAKDNDPRVANAARKIEVIEERIKAERIQLAGENGKGEGTLSTLVGDFERLSVDQEFAEKAYLAALSNFDTAVAKAQQKSRYLAAYIEPTLAESARYPERPLLGAAVSIFLLLLWGVLVLAYYSLRDRR